VARNHMRESLETQSVERSPNPPISEIPFTQCLTCTIKEACNAIGLGRTKLYQLIGEAMIETRQIGRRRLVHIPSLLRHLRMDAS
jgi:excisionase family DNA binding protein